MLEITIGGVGIGAVVAALVYVIRKLGVGTRYLPLISLVIGAALGTVAYFVGEQAVVASIVGGGVIGLATAGGYDVIKKTVLGE